MRDLKDGQNVYCHSTSVLNILKGTVLPSIAEAHTTARRQTYGYYIKRGCRKSHHSRRQRKV